MPLMGVSMMLWTVLPGIELGGIRNPPLKEREIILAHTLEARSEPNLVVA